MANNKQDKILNVPNKRGQRQTRLNVPALRFPEFEGEWKKSNLGNIVKVIKNRVSSETVDIDKYISTENILPNFGGIANSVGKPEKINITAFNPNDILLANIRPYLRKIWLSTFYGGCNADVFVFRPQGINPQFLYYSVANDRFCKYVMNGAKGVKMPRGDKQQMLKFELSVPVVAEQKKIVSLLSRLDARIATQRKIIEKLESLMRGISERLLYSDTGENVKIGDILSERVEKTTENNQYEILSSTIKGMFLQRDYFTKDIASENNIGYKIIRLNDIVLSPQNLWMGNINFNDKFQIGAVSPSYKIFTIAEKFYKPFIAAILKTHRALYNYGLVSEQGASIVRRNLNMEAFEQLTFKIPSYTKQIQLGKALSSLHQQIDLTKKLYSAMCQQKQWLLQQMFI